MSIEHGQHDLDIRRQFGSDSARLVYGRNSETGRLFHISTVSRGLACGLVCPHCNATLVANLKDDLKVAHFAHHGPACIGGPETALHLLCKEIIRDELRLTIPRQRAAHGEYEHLIAEAREISVDRVTLEYRDQLEVIPDLRLEIGELDLFVEIAVTHPSGAEKISRLKRLGMAAFEIDMSSVPRNARPEEVRRAVLSAAPRTWLFNPTIDRAVEELRVRAQQDAAAYAERLTSTARRKIEAYRETRRAAGEQKLRIKDLAAMRALGIRQHLGIPIGGTGCFTVRSETWRSVVLATILRPRTHYRFLETHHIVSRLVEEGYVDKEFVGLPKDVADAMRRLDREFLTPWEAVHRFLQASAEHARLTEQHQLSFALNADLAGRWRDWEAAERRRTGRRDHVSSLVSQILELIPADDRGSMTVASWWQMTKKGRPREQTFDADSSTDRDLEQLLDVLLLRSNTSPRDLHDLPAAGAIGQAIIRKAEDDAKARDMQAKEEADGRRQSLIRLAERTLNDADLTEFFRTPLAEQGGILPLDLAERSVADFELAEKALGEFAQARLAERVATRWRSKLVKEAEELFGRRAARVVRQTIDGKLDERPPLVYCRDETTFRTARGVLHWMARTLASPRDKAGDHLSSGNHD